MSGVQPEGEEDLLQAAKPFESAYLANVLSSMSDAVTLAFPGGNRPLPTAADLQKCIGYIASCACDQAALLQGCDDRAKRGQRGR